MRGGEAIRLLSAGALQGAWGRAVRSYKADPARTLGGLLAAPLVDALVRRNERAQASESGPLVLAPIPMAPVRRRERGWNPAERLAALLARRTGVELATDLVVRRRYRRPLRGLNARARREEVAGAFGPGPAQRTDHARIWLVDDVHTTGATLGAAAGVLDRNGHRVEGALVLARTLKRPGRVETRGRKRAGRPLAERDDVSRDRHQCRSE
jgi:predicted amidophosphoribosyltransferase